MNMSLIVKLTEFLCAFTFCTAITLIICLTKIKDKDVEIFKKVVPFTAGAVIGFIATVVNLIFMKIMNFS